MMIIIISILIIKNSKNYQIFIRGLRRNDWVTTICDSMPDVNDKNIMYYLGSKMKINFFQLLSN